MSNPFDTLDGLFKGDIRGRKAKTRNIDLGSVRAKASRIVSKAPEVMVKITGNARGVSHVGSHLDYISRNGKLELENERGETIKGKAEVRQLQKEWTQDLGRRRKNTRDTTNIVLSMPNGTKPKAVKDAAREFAKKQFADNHQYVFALHTDTEKPHVHLTIWNHGFDGRRLHVKKGDPQKWREGFAAQLRQLGVAAEATPRATRGVVKKPTNQVLRHIRDRVTPDVDKEKIKEIVAEFRDSQFGSPSKPKPWEPKIKERQERVRKAWLSAAKDLHSSQNEEDKELATKIVAFVKDMPPLKTERHELASKVAESINQAHQQKANQIEREDQSKDDQEER